MRTARNKALVLGAGSLTTICAAAALWAGFSSDEPSTEPQPSTAETSTAPGEEVVDVDIVDFAFDPPQLTITAGTTVRWTNVDSFAHSIRTDTEAFAELTMGTDESVVVRFDTPGSYAYFCGIHNSMTAEVVVTA